MTANHDAQQDDKGAEPPRSAVAEARRLVRRIRESSQPPAGAWDEAFTTGSYSSSVLAEAMLLLHEAGLHDLAVEGMLGALRNDHSQPWMYDVLATEMALAGRPAADIERVVSSRIDFAAADVPQMLVTAALLSRLEARGEALKTCREAGELNPSLAAPWLLGRQIADSAGDVDAQIWSRCGILKHVWTEQHSADRREALETLQKIIRSLEESGDREAAKRAKQQFTDANTVDLRITLRWVGAADLDLLVTEPDGERCDQGHPETASGGRLIREDGGAGNRRDGQRIEEYVCHTARSGNYSAAIRFVYGRVVSGTAVVEIVQNENTPLEKRARQTVPLSRDDTVVSVALTSGRGQP